MQNLPGWDAVQNALGEDGEAIKGFGEFLAKAEAPDLEALFEEVDQSDYSLPDWVHAFLAFDQWLESEGRERRPFRGMLGYIHCCTLMNAPQVSLASLNIVVSEALTDYGFDEVNDSQL